jgi:hypothetical protein
MGQSERLDLDQLVMQAVDRAGADDFGEPTWRPGLERFLDSLVHEARLNDIGVEIAVNDVITTLANRLQIIAWRAEHPEVETEVVAQPIVIIGQPRTGTTILFDLLAQDESLRPPLTWEVDVPCPPPSLDTYRSDPRIAEVQASIEMIETLMPGFLAFHPLGAELAQECVRITASDFRSMMFPLQYRIPSYNRWLLHEADMAPAYRWHKRYLQHLQSGVGGQWLLKSPAHLWCLDALAAEYPDAVIVQTHRDPLKVIASVSALGNHLRKMATSETTVAEVAEQYGDDILVGLERGMDARDRGVFPDGQVVDVLYSEFITDQIGTIRRIYTQLGRELSADAEKQMRAFLDSHPGDLGGGRYTWADTGLDADALRPRVTAYQERYGVPSESLV